MSSPPNQIFALLSKCCIQKICLHILPTHFTNVVACVKSLFSYVGDTKCLDYLYGTYCADTFLLFLNSSQHPFNSIKQIQIFCFFQRILKPVLDIYMVHVYVHFQRDFKFPKLSSQLQVSNCSKLSFLFVHFIVKDYCMDNFKDWREWNKKTRKLSNLTHIDPVSRLESWRP